MTNLRATKIDYYWPVSEPILDYFPLETCEPFLMKFYSQMRIIFILDFKISSEIVAFLYRHQYANTVLSYTSCDCDREMSLNIAAWFPESEV